MTYLSLNKFLRKEFGQRVQKIPLDAGLGCPNRDSGKKQGGCIYCNSKGSGTGAFLKGIGIREQIIQGMTWAKRRYKAKKFIAYFQSFSNTYAPLKQLAAIYNQAAEFQEIVGIAIGTRPDCIDLEVLKLIDRIFKGRMIWMEYGLQSASDSTLKKINRGHSVQDFIDAVELTKRFPFLICSHIIFGLPGENHRDMMNTIELIKELQIDGLKFHELYVVKDTALAKLYRHGSYVPLNRYEYALLVARAIKRLPRKIVIQRLTGDPAPDELLAPAWAVNKQETIKLIEQFLETDPEIL